MIAKAPTNRKRGTNTYGLLRYLFGPGRANEHRDPHVVAAWDPNWPDTEPVPQQRGWLTRLAREVDAAMTGHQMAVPGGHVYHVALSVPKVDGALGDRTWRKLVEEAVVRMGFGPDAEGRGGCRWVAVHHGPSKEGNDHVHLVVNLVRGDGRIADTYRDWPRWRRWCLEVEWRLGLTPTPPADKTAPLRPTRAETEKAARMGLPTTSREYLRDVVQRAAARASSAEEFVALLAEDAQVSVEARWDSSDRLSGYRVARRGDHSSPFGGGLVWFAGSQLARDLSVPKLTQRWSSALASPLPLRNEEPTHQATTSRRERHAAVDDATQAATLARDAVLTSNGRSDLIDEGGADLADGVAHATSDLMVATAKAVEGDGHGSITTAAQVYERAAVAPYRVLPARWAPVAAELRIAARRLSRVPALSRNGREGLAVAALVVALAALIAEIAAWREQTQQRQQAAAARRAVDLLNADVAANEPRSAATSPARTIPRQQPGAATPPADRRPSQLPGQRRPVVGQLPSGLPNFRRTR